MSLVTAVATARPLCQPLTISTTSPTVARCYGWCGRSPCRRSIVRARSAAS